MNTSPTPKPHPFTGKTVIDGRLAWFRAEQTGADSWADTWEAQGIAAKLALARQGYLGEHERLFTRYLPQGEPILEAGCGTGRYVLALRLRGYDVIGLDYDFRTLRSIQPHLPPDVPLHNGDGFALPYATGSFGAVISLGVVEHDPDGPAAMLAELARVLRPGGVLVASLPYFNPLRRLKAALHVYPRPAHPARANFYQYALRPQDFICVLETAGFALLEWHGAGTTLGLRTELGALAAPLRQPRLRSAFNRLLGRARAVENFCGHIAFFVATRQ